MQKMTCAEALPGAIEYTAIDIFKRNVGNVLYFDKYGNKVERDSPSCTRTIITGIGGVNTKLPPHLNRFSSPLELAASGVTVNFDASADWTRKTNRNRQPLAPDPAYEEHVKRNIGNIEQNLVKGKPLDDLLGTDNRKTAILLCTGPSLNKAREWLNRIDREKVMVIGMNSAGDCVGRHNLDYLVGVDYRMLPEWGNGMENVTAVFQPMVNPALAAKEFKQVYWAGETGSGSVAELIRAHYSSFMYGVTELDQGINVLSTAMHFAYLMGAENIIIVGMDVARLNEELWWKRDVNQLTTQFHEIDFEMAGMKWKSPLNYYRAARAAYGHAYWLRTSGVVVWNCTEEGPFWHDGNPFPWLCVENEPPITSANFGETIDRLGLGG